MFKRGHKLEYWYSDNDNHKYMDNDGFVYTITYDENENKPKKKVKTMSYFKTKIAIMTVIIITLWTCIAMATGNKTYSGIKLNPGTNPNMITALELEVKWTKLKSLENIILTFNLVSPSKAQLDFEYYLSIKDAIKVKKGFYAVKFVKEFQGFYLYEVLEIVERS